MWGWGGLDVQSFPKLKCGSDFDDVWDIDEIMAIFGIYTTEGGQVPKQCLHFKFFPILVRGGSQISKGGTEIVISRAKILFDILVYGWKYSVIMPYWLHSPLSPFPKFKLHYLRGGVEGVKKIISFFPFL